MYPSTHLLKETQILFDKFKNAPSKEEKDSLYRTACRNHYALVALHMQLIAGTEAEKDIKKALNLIQQIRLDAKFNALTEENAL